MKRVIAVLITVVMIMAMLPTVSFGAEVTYLLRDLNAGGSTEVKLADYQTKETEHFVIIYDTDGANTITDAQLTQLETVLENCWTLFIDKMGMEPTSTSVHDNGDKVTQYKTNVVIMGTGVDHYTLGAGEWGAYGSVDTAGYPYFMCSVTAVSSPTVVAHEFGHAVHYSQGDNAWENNIYLGPWFEAVANWFAEQYIYEYMTGSTTQLSHLYLRAGHLTKMNGRAYYEAWPFLQYLTEDLDNTGIYGETFVQKLLAYDSGSTSTLFWEVLEANNGDLTVADTVGMYASHMANMDFNKKERYDSAINSAYYNGTFYWQQRYTILEGKGEEVNTYVVPPERAPQAMGYNIVPLEFTPGEVTVALNGETQAAGADWRARIAKVDSSGNTAYSSLFSDGESMSMTATATDKLYLTVAATPAIESMSRHTITGWADHSTEKNFPYENKTQYPYSVTITGATPMERALPTVYNGSSITWKTHSNGGGKVASTATVASTAYVGENAIVMGYAKVSDNAVIDGHAIVSGNAVVSGNAYVGDYAVLFDRAEVTDNARVIENACLYVDYTAKDNAVIKGSTLGLYNGTAGGEAITYGDFFEDVGLTISGGAFSGYHSGNDSTYSKTLQSAYVRDYVVNLRSRYEFENNLRDTYTYTDLYGVNMEYEDGQAVFDGSNYAILDSSAIYYDNSKMTLALSGEGEALSLGSSLSLTVEGDTVSIGGAEVVCGDDVKNIEITLDGENVLLDVNGIESTAANTITLTDCAASGISYIGKGFTGKIDYVRIYDMGYVYTTEDIGSIDGNIVEDINTVGGKSKGAINNYTTDTSSLWYGWSSTSSNVAVDGGLNITGAITGTINAPQIQAEKFIIEFDPEGGKAYPDHGILDADGTKVLFAHRYATDASAIHVGRGEINASVRGTESVSDTTGQARLSNFIGERIASGSMRTDRSAIDFTDGSRVRIIAENKVWDAVLAEDFAKCENSTSNLEGMAEGDEIYSVTYGKLDKYGLFTPVSVSLYKGNMTGFGGFKIAGGTSNVTVSYKNLVISSDAGNDNVAEIIYTVNGKKVKTVKKRSGATFAEVYKYANGENEIYYAESKIYTENMTVEMTELANNGDNVGTYYSVGNNAYKSISGNLIPNGDFSQGLTGWYNSAGGEATEEFFTVNSNGTITAKSSQGAGGEGSLYRAWDVEQGKTYVFTYTSNVENQYHVVSQKNDITLTNDGNAVGTSIAGENSFAFTATKEYLQINFRWLGSSNIIGNFGLYEVTSAESDRANTTIRFKSADTEIAAAVLIEGFPGDVIDLTDESIVPETMTYNGEIYIKDSTNPISYTVNGSGEVTVTYTVSDIQSIESVSVSVIGDNVPVLPKTVTATTSNGTMELTVEWDYSTLIEGEKCIVYGTVEGTVLKAEAVVNVLTESFTLPDSNSTTSGSGNIVYFPLSIPDEFHIEFDFVSSNVKNNWIYISNNGALWGSGQIGIGTNNDTTGQLKAQTLSDVIATITQNTKYRMFIRANAAESKYDLDLYNVDTGELLASVDARAFRKTAASVNSINLCTNGGGAYTLSNIKVSYPGYAQASFVNENGDVIKKVAGSVQNGATFTVDESVGFLIDDSGNGHFYKIPQTVVSEDCKIVAEELTDRYAVIEDAYVQGTTVNGIGTANTDNIFVAAVAGSDRAPLQDADNNYLRGSKDPSTLGTARVGLFNFPVMEIEDGKAVIAHFYVRSWHSNTFSNSNDSIRMAGYALNDNTWMSSSSYTASKAVLLDSNPMFTSRSANEAGYITLDITENIKKAHSMGLDTITIRLNAAWGAAYIADRESAVSGGKYEGMASYLTIEDGTYITVSGSTKVTKDGSKISSPENGVTIPDGASIKMYTDGEDVVAFTNESKVYAVTSGVTDSIMPEAGGYYPAAVGVNMLQGGQVRIGDGVDAEGKLAGDNGIRFIGQINRNDTLATVSGATYMVKITAESSNAVKEIPIEKWQSPDVFSVAMTNLAIGNYNRQYTATPCITVDGQTFEGKSVTRSIYKVAAGILINGYRPEDNVTSEDKTDTEYILSQVLVDVLNAYVNGTGVRLTLSSDGVITSREAGNGSYTGDAFFNVTYIDNNDGSYTVTITPKENAQILSWWKDYVRINNNNSAVKAMITEDTINESGVLTFKFTPTVANN